MSGFISARNSTRWTSLRTIAWHLLIQTETWKDKTGSPINDKHLLSTSRVAHWHTNYIKQLKRLTTLWHTHLLRWYLYPRLQQSSHLIRISWNFEEHNPLSWLRIDPSTHLPWIQWDLSTWQLGPDIRQQGGRCLSGWCSTPCASCKEM